jgi:hypothetical protein
MWPDSALEKEMGTKEHTRFIKRMSARRVRKSKKRLEITEISCGATGPDADTKEEAAERRNKRAANNLAYRGRA